MTIIPQQNLVQLKIDEVTAGVLDTSSKETAVECAEIIALGKWADKEGSLKVGDKVFVKAWAIDIITFEDKKYYFCNIETGGILAVVK